MSEDCTCQGEKIVKEDMNWKDRTLIDGQGRLLFSGLKLKPWGNKRGLGLFNCALS